MLYKALHRWVWGFFLFSISGAIAMIMLAALAVLLLTMGAIWLFNALVRLRNQVRVAWSDVDVQLQRRHDLVPTLVASVKAYAKHESQLLASITAERCAAMLVQTPAARSAPETAVARSLGHLMVLSEAYPELKASANFAQLTTELVEVENALQHARRFYNGSVREFNNAIESFPSVLVARTLAFKPAEFFAADNEARASIAVTLDAGTS
ncbi:MAG: LemA family protein [Xanthomonadales bacterium]|nr:LemA family protein [Xanthomonadales bacterium]